MIKKKKLKLKKGKVLLICIELICLGFIIFSLLKILNWNSDNNKVKKIKKEIIDDVVIKKGDNEEIDFKKLKKTNADTVAYLIVPNTNISYPVVKYKNNDYYLNHDFLKEYSEAGWVFANYKNRFDDTDKNITIFGHARINGEMFGSLKKTLSKEWQQNSDNHKIKLITEENTHIYEVFSTYKIKVEDYYITSEFNSDNSYLKFLKTMKSRSNHNYNVDLDINDSILTLSNLYWN